jgi:Zn-dependent M28 family amino/carboxypeptidase
MGALGGSGFERKNRWKREPVEGVELVVLFTGCEETGVLGATAWVEAHKDERPLACTSFLVLDTLAYGAPRFLAVEHTLAATPVHYRPDMIRLCEAAARRLGIQGAGPHAVPTFTDAVPFVLHGIAGASVLTFDDSGYLPNLHQMSDTSANLNFDVAWQAVEFSWEVLKDLAKRKG